MSLRALVVRHASTVLILAAVASMLATATARAGSLGTWTQVDVQTSADKAIAYIDSWHKPSGAVEETSSAPVVETAMALVAYSQLAKGNFANLSPTYQKHAEEALKWLLGQQVANGSWTVAGGDETYATGTALGGLGVFFGMSGLTPIAGMPAAISAGRTFLQKEFKGSENGYVCTAGQQWCGGWSYEQTAEKRSDQSNTGFAMFGLQVTGGVPAGIAAQNITWQHNVQALAGNPFNSTNRTDGGGSYQPAYVDETGGLKDFASNANDTGSLLFGLAYDGVGATDAHTVAARVFAERALGVYELDQRPPNTRPGDTMVFHSGLGAPTECEANSAGCEWHTQPSEGGFHYSLFALGKGLVDYVTPELFNSANWYAKTVDLLLKQQEANGAWPVDGRDDLNALLATEFSVPPLEHGFGSTQEPLWYSNGQLIPEGKSEEVLTGGKVTFHFLQGEYSVPCTVTDHETILNSGGVATDELTSFVVSKCSSKRTLCPGGNLEIIAQNLPWKTHVMGGAPIRDAIEGVALEVKCNGSLRYLYTGTLAPAMGKSTLEFSTQAGHLTDGTTTAWLTGTDKLTGPPGDEEVTTKVPPEKPVWNVTGVVQTISWGKLTFSAPNVGTVTCKKSDAGNVWNSQNGGGGLDETVLFDLYECSSATCRAPVVTASGLPWASSLEEAPLGSGVIRDRTKGMTLKIECATSGKSEEESGPPLVEVFSGDVTPRLHNGTKSASYEEFDAASGSLAGEHGSLTISGNDYMAGFEHSELITGSPKTTKGGGGTEPVKKGWELAIGAAETFGYSQQLFNENAKAGEPASAFEHGYANDYLNLGKPKVSGNSLVNVGCPGETTASMIGNGPLAGALGVTGEAPCPYHNSAGLPLHHEYGGKSQIESALELIGADEALGTPVRTVTLSIGQSDVARAISRCEHEVQEEFGKEGKSQYGSTPQEAVNGCLASHAHELVTAIVANIGKALYALRNGGLFGGVGYAGRIVVLGGYDPYGNVKGTGELIAGSNAFQGALNKEEGKMVEAEFGGCFVDPRPLFNPGGKQEPGRLQSWTNMANTTSFEGKANGPDLDPTPAGYEQLAKAMRTTCG